MLAMDVIPTLTLTPTLIPIPSTPPPTPSSPTPTTPSSPHDPHPHPRSDSETSSPNIEDEGEITPKALDSVSVGDMSTSGSTSGLGLGYTTTSTSYSTTTTTTTTRTGTSEGRSRSSVEYKTPRTIPIPKFGTVNGTGTGSIRLSRARTDGTFITSSSSSPSSFPILDPREYASATIYSSPRPHPYPDPDLILKSISKSSSKSNTEYRRIPIRPAPDSLEWQEWRDALEKKFRKRNSWEVDSDDDDDADDRGGARTENGPTHPKPTIKETEVRVRRSAYAFTESMARFESLQPPSRGLGIAIAAMFRSSSTQVGLRPLNRDQNQSQGGLGGRGFSSSLPYTTTFASTSTSTYPRARVRDSTEYHSPQSRGPPPHKTLKHQRARISSFPISLSPSKSRARRRARRLGINEEDYDPDDAYWSESDEESSEESSGLNSNSNWRYGYRTEECRICHIREVPSLTSMDYSNARHPELDSQFSIRTLEGLDEGGVLPTRTRTREREHHHHGWGSRIFAFAHLDHHSHTHTHPIPHHHSNSGSASGSSSGSHQGGGGEREHGSNCSRGYNRERTTTTTTPATTRNDHRHGNRNDSFIVRRVVRGSDHPTYSNRRARDPHTCTESLYISWKVLTHRVKWRVYRIKKGVKKTLTRKA